MKKFVTILLISSIALISCHKEYIEPVQNKQEVDIFSVTENIISNEDQLSFSMGESGSYLLKITDLAGDQVLSKEKIDLINGKNTIKIYTKSLPAGTLNLLLEDLNKNEVKRTKITIK